jgi:hypothetical protein
MVRLEVRCDSCPARVWWRFGVTRCWGAPCHLMPQRARLDGYAAAQVVVNLPKDWDCRTDELDTGEAKVTQTRIICPRCRLKKALAEAA